METLVWLNMPKSTWFDRRVCEYERANKQDYCTLSMRGISRFRSDDDTECIKLSDWEQELTFFHTLIKVIFTLPLRGVIVSTLNL